MGFSTDYNFKSFLGNDSLVCNNSPQYNWNLQYSTMPPVFMFQNNNFGLPQISLNVQPLNLNFSFLNNTNLFTQTGFNTTFSNFDTFTYTSQNSSSNGNNTLSKVAGRSPIEHTTFGNYGKINLKGGYSTAKHVPKEAKPYYPLIQKYAKIYNVPEALILSVMHAESGFNPNAESHCGAKGLMQLMPGTAEDNGVTDVYDPEQNIEAGVKILSKYLKLYNGDLNKTLAAYNWGPGNLQRKGLANMPQETRNYLTKVTSYAEQYGVA